MRQTWFRCRALFRRKRLEAEMAEELRDHFENEVQRKVAAGMLFQEALSSARRDFGGEEQIKELCRAERRFCWLEDAWIDLRHGMRGLRREPGFATIMVTLLALGIGATTALFSVVNTVMLRPLPYREPERLVRVWDTNARRGLTDFPASVANFVSWQQESRLFTELAAWRYGSSTLRTASGPERVQVTRISSNLLPLLGVAPPLGRGFTVAEDRPGDDRVVLISERLWRERFQRSDTALGETLVLDGEPHTVVGVAPTPLAALAAGDLWKPLAPEPEREPRSMHWLRVIGRLAPGASLASAQREMDAIAAQLAKQFPDSNEHWGIRLESFRDWIVPGHVRKALVVLFGAVVCVLLIGGANLANLLLVRTLGRTREIAVRAALGASRGRIARQLGVEVAGLVFLGGSAGCLLAVWAVHALQAFRPGDLPRLDELGVDATSMVFALGISLVTALLASVLPVWHAARLDLQPTLKAEGKGATTTRRFTQSALVVGQFAFSLVLLAAASLFAQSFLRLQNAPLGFQPENVRTFRLTFPGTGYTTAQSQNQFIEELGARIKALPSVQSVSVTSALPFDAATYRMTTRVGGRNSVLAQGELLSVERFNVGPDYFRTLGTPLRSGRFFESRDNASAPHVALINEAAARRLWPGQDAVGKTVIWNLPLTVVGVVADVKNVTLERPAQPALYVCAYQQPLPTLAWVVHMAHETTGWEQAVRSELRRLHPELPMFDSRALTDLLEAAAARPRFNAGVIAAFAGSALVLAALGLYGVMAYLVTRRTREFGVRIALGARPSDLRRLVLSHGAKIAATGIAIGLLASVGAARFLRGLLHEVSAEDPVTFATTALALIGASLLACWFPARRAMAVDPMTALRTE